MEYIHANLDAEGVTPSAGSGWRTYLVVSVGPQWVKLLHIPDLTFVTLHRSQKSKMGFIHSRRDKATHEDHLDITYDELWERKIKGNRPKVLSKDHSAIAELIRRKMEERERLGMEFARVSITKIVNELEGKPTGTAAAAVMAPKISDRPRPPGGNLEAAVELLKAEGGATIDDLCAKTGWLAHSARAALTNLRGKGFTIDRKKEARGTVYRIPPPEEPSEKQE